MADNNKLWDVLRVVRSLLVQNIEAVDALLTFYDSAPLEPRPTATRKRRAEKRSNKRERNTTGAMVTRRCPRCKLDKPYPKDRHPRRMCPGCESQVEAISRKANKRGPIRLKDVGMDEGA